MKHNLINISFLFFTVACTATKHELYPKYGYAFHEDDKIIIGEFQNARTPAFTEYATQFLGATFSRCQNLQVIPYDSVQNILFNNLIYTDPVWRVDTTFLTKINQVVEADYLLVSEVLDKSAYNSLVTIADTYGTGQTEPIKENWVIFQFSLYDLLTKQNVLTLHTKVKARHYNYEDNSGDVVSIHAPVGVSGKALAKGVEKLYEACHCEKE